MNNLLKYTNLFSFIDHQYSLYYNQFNQNNEEHFSIGETFTSIRNLFSIIIYLSFVIVSAILAWRCNSEYNKTQRIVITIIAAILGPWYLLYYSFYHNILNKNCDHGLIKQETFNKISATVKNTTQKLTNNIKIGGSLTDDMNLSITPY